MGLRNLFRKQKKELPVKSNLNEESEPWQGSRLPDGSSKQQKKQALVDNAAPKDTSHVISYAAMYENGVCDLGSGYFSRTVAFSDINYQAARQDEKEDILAHYCEFLNSVEAENVQISLINRHIDQASFKEEILIPLTGDSYDIYRDDYNAMLSEKGMEGQNSFQRSKYITITAPARDVMTATATLSRVEGEIMSNFKALGCGVSSLSGMQRLSLLHSILRHGDPFCLKDYDDLLLSGLSSREFIAPLSMDFSSQKTFRLGDKYASTLILRDYPTDMSDKLFSDLSDLPIDLIATIHFKRMDQATALELVRRKLAMMEMEQAELQDKASRKGYTVSIATPSLLKRKYAGTKELLDDLSEGNQRMFKATMLIYTYADTEKELNSRVQQIKTVAAQNNCAACQLEDQQLQALNSTLPIGRNEIHIQRTMTTEALSVFTPFTTQELYDPTGMYYGLNAISRNVIKLNRYNLPSPGGWILGSPGSGKSVQVKHEVISVLLSDPNAEVIIIDPEREYLPLSRAFGGENIRISAGSKTYLNPFDITEDYSEDDPLLLKSEFILTLMELLIGGKDGLSAGDRTIISRACMLCYQKYFASNGKAPIPTLQDFQEILKQQPEENAKGLALALELYTTGALSVFGHRTNVDTDRRFIVYDIRDLGKQLRTFGMLVVLDQIWCRVTRNRAKGIHTWIYVDEVQLLFNNVYAEQYFFEIWSRARKWGGIPTGATQNIETLLLSDRARRMLSNSDYVVLMNQSPADRIELAGLLSMSNKQLSFVTGANPGEGLLIAGKSVIPFSNIYPKNGLYKIITTKLSEVANGIQ